MIAAFPYVFTGSTDQSSRGALALRWCALESPPKHGGRGHGQLRSGKAGTSDQTRSWGTTRNLNLNRPAGPRDSEVGGARGLETTLRHSLARDRDRPRPGSGMRSSSRARLSSARRGLRAVTVNVFPLWLRAQRAPLGFANRPFASCRLKPTYSTTSTAAAPPCLVSRPSRDALE